MKSENIGKKNNTGLKSYKRNDSNRKPKNIKGKNSAQYSRTKTDSIKTGASVSGDIRSSMPDPAEIKEILGIVSDFKINKLTPIGAFLSPVMEAGENFEILLPKNEFADKELKRGENIRAFTYLDSEDRPIATLRTPALSLGGLALLKCNQVTSLGAFLDWGLIKDLFIPFKEQTVKIKAGDEVLVTLYMDKSSRLCASMKIYKLLRTDSPYKANDHVTGLVYELSDRHGAYVAVDNIYSALIPNRELVKNLKVGDRPELRVSKVLSDGKLELSMREQSYLQLDSDCERILKELNESSKGFLPYHDKTESLIIKNRFNMSKIAFKRAIGHLYKSKKIDILEDGIALRH